MMIVLLLLLLLLSLFLLLLLSLSLLLLLLLLSLLLSLLMMMMMMMMMMMISGYAYSWKSGRFTVLESKRDANVRYIIHDDTMLKMMMMMMMMIIGHAAGAFALVEASYRIPHTFQQQHTPLHCRQRLCVNMDASHCYCHCIELLLKYVVLHGNCS